jgi:hypothetical protein
VLGLAASGCTRTATRSRAACSRRRARARSPAAGRRRASASATRCSAPHRWYGQGLLPLVGGNAVRAWRTSPAAASPGTWCACCPREPRAASRRAWPRPALFRWLIEAGRVPEDDARVAFNSARHARVVEPRFGGRDAPTRGAGETVWTSARCRRRARRGWAPHS